MVEYPWGRGGTGTIFYNSEKVECRVLVYVDQDRANDKDPTITANYLSFVVGITWAVSGRSESRLLSGTTR
jgi:hypothetical protein